MRPVTLEVVGFSAFREPAAISFADADLVAFVGPTGSGKSSLIDAMTFALYGSVSRYDDARLVEPVIHKLATEARVRLDFELDGTAYTAVRVVRRTKQGATTKEARLVRRRPDDGDDGATLAGAAPEMTREVQRLLGLDFDQFTRTVVLPQGQFAAFLHEDKGKRQQLLRQLLDVGIYERMGRESRQRAAQADTRAQLLTEQRDGKPEVTDDQLAALAAKADGLHALQDTAASHLERIGALHTELATVRSGLAALLSLRTALRDVELPAAVASLAAELAVAEADAAEAQATLDGARSARDAVQREVDEGPDGSAVERTLDLLDRRAQLEAEIARSGLLAAEADAGAAASTETEAKAQAALDAAEAVLATAKDAAGAEALVASLVEGQPCPVCRQVVAALPDHDLGAELKAATAARNEAKLAQVAAAKARAEAERVQTRLTVELRTQRDGLDLLVSGLPPDADEATLRAERARAVALRERSRTALAAAQEAEQATATATAAVGRLRSRESSLRAAYTDARDSVSGRRPPTPAGSLADDWGALVAWAATMAGPVQAEITEAQQAEATVTVSLEAELTAVRDACAPYDLDPDPVGLGERIATAAARAVHDLEDATRARAERERLDAQIAALDEERVVAKAMGLHLSVNGFERWLLQEALDDLVARATDRLLELSSGQFSLGSDDGDFWIRDHRNADERRDVRTLSGGETFLAALALALALADNVAELAVEGGPRLESMFLDEGFGTLDPETLDVVATAMEELSASGRLIGIVTHIRDLADRMPVRYEVHRDTTSARVERLEA